MRINERQASAIQDETFAKKLFPQQPKPKQRFSAVFIPNHSCFYSNTPLISLGYLINQASGRLLGGNRRT